MINVPRLTVLVPGAIYTHRVEIIVPKEQLAPVAASSSSTGTLLSEDLRLSERDRDVVVALASGFLKGFPHRNPHPLTYQEAADVLGAPWTKVTLRKQIERLRERLARLGIYVEGQQANYELLELLEVQAG